MKKVLIILLTFIFGSTGCCKAQIPVRNEIAACISRMLAFQDPNPSHQEDNENIISLFEKALNIYVQGYNTGDSELIPYSFDLLVYNSYYDFEDSIDAVRMNWREAMCFIAVSLLLPSEKQKTFLGYADSALGDGLGRSEFTSYRIGFHLLGILYDYDAGELNEKKIDKIRKSVEVENEDIFYYVTKKDILKLLNRIQSTLKN